MVVDMREKNHLGLCMKYSESCKFCPRSKKCEEELNIEENELKRVSVKRKMSVSVAEDEGSTPSPATK